MTNGNAFFLLQRIAGAIFMIVAIAFNLYILFDQSSDRVDVAMGIVTGSLLFASAIPLYLWDEE